MGSRIDWAARLASVLFSSAGERREVLDAYQARQSRRPSKLTDAQRAEVIASEEPASRIVERLAAQGVSITEDGIRKIRRQGK